MPTPDPDRQQFAALTNALQTALLLAQRLGPDLQQVRDTTDDLRAAVERAADAAHRLRPSDGGAR